MHNIHEVVRRPLVTEKSTNVKAQANQYVLEVGVNFGKLEIRQAIEKLFKVKVLSINTASIPGKFRRMGRSVGGYRPKWKKAYVRLQAGQEIRYAEDTK
jgi:large subunit ribosomal protein L23